MLGASLKVLSDFSDFPALLKGKVGPGNPACLRETGLCLFAGLPVCLKANAQEWGWLVLTVHLLWRCWKSLRRLENTPDQRVLSRVVLSCSTVLRMVHVATSLSPKNSTLEPHWSSHHFQTYFVWYYCVWRLLSLLVRISLSSGNLLLILSILPFLWSPPAAPGRIGHFRLYPPKAISITARKPCMALPLQTVSQI